MVLAFYCYGVSYNKLIAPKVNEIAQASQE